MIIIYYGNGKGKTTAALGLALRASGYKKKILFAQFIKSPKSLTGEDKSLKTIKNLVHKKFGLGFVGLYDDSKPLKDHRKAAEAGFESVKSMIKRFDIVVLDEFLGAIKGNLIDLKSALEFIRNFPKQKDLVLTGRTKYSQIINLADLVSEVKEVKHPFKKGKMAKEGIDF
jgi:cob(I)alamin adenosyltransferase